MLLLKQSTSATVKIGPFSDSTNGDDDETALTITQADVRLSKNGGNMAQKNDATSCTHDELGVYDCPLDATDTNTLGILRLDVHESGALHVWHEYMVVPANIYDSLVSGSDYLQVDVEQLDGDATAAANLNTACDNYSATRGLAGTALPAAAADGAGGLPISDAGGLDLDTILGRITGNVALASVVGALDDAAAAGDPTTADTLMQYIKQLINVLIGTTGVTTFPAEAAPANNVSLSEVIRAIHADVTGLNGDAMRGTDSAALASVCTEARLAELDAANLPADITGLNDPTAAAIADAVWDEDIEGAHGTDATAGLLLRALGAAISNRANNANLNALLGVPDSASADVQSAVWDEQGPNVSTDLSLMIERIYRFLLNKMNITDASGAVALRNEGDSSDIMTQTITDNDTTTVRTAASWT